MCGRFTQHLSWAELRRLADLIGQPRNLALNYNIAPTMQIEVLRPAEGGCELIPMRWGLFCPFGGKRRSRSLATRSTLGPRRLRTCRCGATLSSRDVALSTRAASMNGRDQRARAFLIIPARQTDDHSPWRAYGNAGAPLTRTKTCYRRRSSSAPPMSGCAPITTVCRSFSTGATPKAWMTGDDLTALLRPVREDALREWTVSTRVNKAGVGDDEPALIEALV
jgi:hypothetical protein